MADYRRQHLVSKTLQKRFAGTCDGKPNHLALVVRNDPSRVRCVGPRSNLKEDWFIRPGAERYERLWGDVESAVAPALQDLDSQAGAPTSPLSSDVTTPVADFMALHLVRSFAAQPLWTRALRRVIPMRRASMAKNAHLMGLARSSGLFADDASDEEIVDEITKDFKEPLRKGGEAFGDVLVDLFEDVRAHFRSMHLEIGQAQRSEFLLPDVPCAPFHQQSGGSGLLAGFGLNQADAIVMPLGPKLIASLTTSRPTPEWLVLADSQVDPINVVLARTAISAVCFRPGSRLEQAIQSAWQKP